MSDGKHTLALSNGAARWLGLYLNQPQILKKTFHVFGVGMVLNEHLIEVLMLPEDKTIGAEWEKWSEERHKEFEITEGQREAIKLGLMALAERGDLSPNKYTIELLPIFGLHTP